VFSKITNFFSKFKTALTPIEDQWTLKTVEGEVYEEVVVERLNAESVTFRHRVGRLRLPLEALTQESKERVVHGFQDVDLREHASIEAKSDVVPLDKPAKSQ
jgi:hypothetical protein